MSNIVEVVVADKNLATMSKYVKAAGLDEALAHKGPFTIFAPTDIAFSKLPEEKRTALLRDDNNDTLNDLLKHHVVEGELNITDLKNDQKLVTMNGRELHVKVNGDNVSINGANLQTKDSKGSNGVVHTLDAVIELN